ncbi:MAG: hypothetical protein BGO78_11265 [Chloroflexi bacterium 44-23]|nr:MAG: hypothetical protein BGO78_11265 [Chloroflexi bacterium 44-23]
MKIHTWAWLAWLSAGLIVLLSTRNPFYLLLLATILIIFQSSLPEQGSLSSVSILRFAASIFVFSTIFNAIISRYGETTLMTIPGKIPLISGNITLEALIFGAINGLVLINMFTLFTIVNQVLPVKNLVRLIPQAFQPVALVTTIALTFIPATQRQFSAIREAQALRGQSLKRLRDWLPLFIPLLTGGLERALQIAEAMTARGYTMRSSDSPSTTWLKWVLPAGLLLLTAGGFLGLFTGLQIPGWILFGSGLLLFLLFFILGGRQFKKTYFQEEIWTVPSYLTFISALTVAIIFLLPTFSHNSLAYEPYPRISLPLLQILPLLALLLFLLPLIWQNDPH